MRRLKVAPIAKGRKVFTGFGKAVHARVKMKVAAPGAQKSDSDVNGLSSEQNLAPSAVR